MTNLLIIFYTLFGSYPWNQIFVLVFFVHFFYICDYCLFYCMYIHMLFIVFCPNEDD